jgi:hypothetical protein
MQASHDDESPRFRPVLLVPSNNNGAMTSSSASLFAETHNAHQPIHPARAQATEVAATPCTIAPVVTASLRDFPDVV